ncbi:MAG TPA: LPS export ABC transporter permease LptF, partial [Gammaproteobacteria bacterium]|nr:LPS export ABC transporter permease LptF [Gammaproteobacteria bacterium]
MIIDRYLAKEVVQAMLAVLLVLLLIFLGRFFAVYLSDALAGKISAAIVLDMLMLRTVTALS